MKSLEETIIENVEFKATAKAYHIYADKQKALIDETDAIDLASVDNDRLENIFLSTQACWLSVKEKSIKQAWGKQLLKIGDEMKRRGYVIKLEKDGLVFNWF